MKTNLPIVTFVQRQWMLIVFALATNWLTLTGHKFTILGEWQLDEMKGGIWVTHTPFEYFGAILYVPPFASTVLIFALLGVHLLYRQTIDRDTHDGTYLQDWAMCSCYQRVLISNIVRIGFIIGFCILCAGLARGSEVDQVRRWNEAQINPKSTIALDVAVKLFERTKPRYQTIQAMRKNGVPAPILFCLHYRESDNDFRCSLAQGDPLTHRSRNVPRGRLPDKEPPYQWEECATDAVYVVDKLDKVDWSKTQTALQGISNYNGSWYDRHGYPTPYLWSKTSIYSSGKFVRDGVFDRRAIDAQLGVCAILKRMRDRGVTLPF